MDTQILSAIENNSVVAIIPARAGSKGVKNKNVRCLRGYPMIAYSIVAAKLSSDVDRVIVSTDSDYYARIAEYYGAEVPFLRPVEFASDNSPDIEFMQHLIKWLFLNECWVPEYFVHLRPTYPLRDYNLIGKAVKQIKNDNTATSLRSAHKADVSPFKWFQMDQGKYFKPMYSDMTLDDANRPRQAFPDVYIPDGYVDVLKTDNIVRNDNMHGTRMIGFVVDDGIDVDNLKDFVKLEELFEGIDFPILKYLKENFKTLEESGL